MGKTRAILHVDSYSLKDGTLTLSTTDSAIKVLIKELTETSRDKSGGYLRVDMSPYKQRSTGKYSQNNLIWKLITEISEYTGYDLVFVEDYAKKKAIPRGYPYKINPFTGEMRPASMTEIDTEEAGHLIEALYQIISELEIMTEAI